jgi:hypothetical protein
MINISDIWLIIHNLYVFVRCNFLWAENIYAWKEKRFLHMLAHRQWQGMSQFRASRIFCICSLLYHAFYVAYEINWMHFTRELWHLILFLQQPWSIQALGNCNNAYRWHLDWFCKFEVWKVCWKQSYSYCGMHMHLALLFNFHSHFIDLLHKIYIICLHIWIFFQSLLCLCISGVAYVLCQHSTRTS